MSTEQIILDRYVSDKPHEVARHAEALDSDARTSILAANTPERSAALIQRVAPVQASEALRRMDREAAAGVLQALPIEVAASLLRRLPEDVAGPVLDALPAALAVALRQLLAHRPDTAGAVADPLALVVSHRATVAEASKLVEAGPPHLYYYVYVVDDDHRLAGVFDLAELMRARPDDTLARLMTPEVTWLAADATLETVFAHPGWHLLDAMPVVDANGRYLGVLRHRRMRQLREERGAQSDKDGAVRTVVALGEIYWLGLCGLVQGFATAAAPESTKEAVR
jgi:magnesium transporter